MTPSRIILITSSQSDPERIPDSEFRDQIINTYPNIANHEFECLGIEPSAHMGDFSILLETIANQFGPDYIMIHTGLGFRRFPSTVVNAILNLSIKKPAIKAGFQRGKEAAIEIILSRDNFGWGGERVAESDVISILETEAVFVETDELREFIKEIFFPHI